MKLFIRKNMHFLFLFFAICLFLTSCLTNNGYFARISTQNIIIYEFKQCLLLISFFIFGYLLLKLLQNKLSEMWICLLSFPAGLSLYVFCAEAFLLCDFTMQLWRVFVLEIIFLGLLFLIRFKRQRSFIKFPATSFVPMITVVCSIALVLSTGFIYIGLNYDSYFYFANYGNTLSKFMCYKDFISDDTYVLTNIGQFLPIACSYAYFWGLDAPHCIHVAMLSVSILSFGYFIYEKSITNQMTSKRAILLTSIFLIMLLSCSPFFLFGTWLLSNSWIMFYMIFFYIIFDKYVHSKESLSFEYAFILCGILLSITMLRKDGLVIACFLIIIISFFQASQYYTRSDTVLYPNLKSRMKDSLVLGLIFLPSLIYMTMYIYVIKHVLYATVHTAWGTSLLSGKATQLILLSLATLLFVIILYRPIEFIFRRFLPLAGLLSFAVLICYYIYKSPNDFLDYIDTWARNLTGIGFGYSIFMLLFLVCIIILLSKRIDCHIFLLFGYILLTVVLYWNKGVGEQDIDNSALRAMIQIIPILFMVCASRIIERHAILFPSRTS